MRQSVLGLCRRYLLINFHAHDTRSTFISLVPHFPVHKPKNRLVLFRSSPLSYQHTVLIVPQLQLFLLIFVTIIQLQGLKFEDGRGIGIFLRFYSQRTFVLLSLLLGTGYRPRNEAIPTFGDICQHCNLNNDYYFMNICEKI